MIRHTANVMQFTRSFSTTAFLLKKKSTEASSRLQPSISTDAGTNFDNKAMKSALEATLSHFSEKVKEAKSNTVSTEKFQNLLVDIGQGSLSPLKSLATIAARGNKLNIVAFDPKQTKRIQSAIVSELGIPAEPSAMNKQTLSVTVPQQTESKKATSAKLIKDAFENLRNNSGEKHSIANIRARYLAPLKKAATKSSGVSKDDLKKQSQEIEKLAKMYAEKLQTIYQKSV